MLFHQKWREIVSIFKIFKMQLVHLMGLYEWYPEKTVELTDQQQIHDISQKITSFLGVYFVPIFSRHIMQWPKPGGTKKSVRSYGSVHFALSWWLQKRQEEVRTHGPLMVWLGCWSSVVMSGTVLRKCQIYGYAFILCVCFFFPGRNSLLKVQTSHVLYQFQLITWMSFFCSSCSMPGFIHISSGVVLRCLNFQGRKLGKSP